MKSLIILDWDDTLFPTSWVKINKKNLFSDFDINKHLTCFTHLDNIICNLFNAFFKDNKIIIVTNASKNWVIKSSQVIPNASKFLVNKIEIISARDKYEYIYPLNVDLWKTKTFHDVMHENMEYDSIISIGDDKYEFIATINLYKENINKICKTIRFLKSPNYNDIIQQLEILIANSDKICNTRNNMDLLIKMAI
jgi:hypothetical protein